MNRMYLGTEAFLPLLKVRSASVMTGAWTLLVLLFILKRRTLRHPVVSVEFVTRRF